MELCSSLEFHNSTQQAGDLSQVQLKRGAAAQSAMRSSSSPTVVGELAHLQHKVRGALEAKITDTQREAERSP